MIGLLLVLIILIGILRKQIVKKLKQLKEWFVFIVIELLLLFANHWQDILVILFWIAFWILVFYMGVG